MSNIKTKINFRKHPSENRSENDLRLDEKLIDVVISTHNHPAGAGAEWSFRMLGNLSFR